MPQWRLQSFSSFQVTSTKEIKRDWKCRSIYSQESYFLAALEENMNKNVKKGTLGSWNELKCFHFLKCRCPGRNEKLLSVKAMRVLLSGFFLQSSFEAWGTNTLPNYMHRFHGPCLVWSRCSWFSLRMSRVCGTLQHILNFFGGTMRLEWTNHHVISTMNQQHWQSRAPNILEDGF